MNSDIRWKQRFENYQKAFNQLTEFIEKGELNKFEKQGLIQCFEYTYELAWSLMKDYLQYQGVVGIGGSRDAIRQAFKLSLISDGQIWLDMVEDRIHSVHTYDEEKAEEIITKIYQIHYPLLSIFYETMKQKCQILD